MYVNLRAIYGQFKRPIKRPFKRPTFVYVDPCKLFKFTPMAFLQEEGLQQKGTWGVPGGEAGRGACPRNS